MALPKIMVRLSEPSVNAAGNDASLNAMVYVITPDQGVIGGGVGVTYTGSEQLPQLKSSLVSAALAMAAGQGYSGLTANDVIIDGFEKG